MRDVVDVAREMRIGKEDGALDDKADGEGWGRWREERERKKRGERNSPRCARVEGLPLGGWR